MENEYVIDLIRKRFGIETDEADIPYLRENRTFKAIMTDAGVHVSNLAIEPFLPWSVFIETVTLLKRKGGRAPKGDAMNSKLGDRKLSLESVEGHVANIIYGKNPGDSVFRRITPIVCILVWAGICINRPGELELKVW